MYSIVFHNLWNEFSKAVARLGFKRRATAVLKSINCVPHGNSTPFETRLEGRENMEMSELLWKLLFLRGGGGGEGEAYMYLQISAWGYTVKETFFQVQLWIWITHSKQPRSFCVDLANFYSQLRKS